jgi:hypothetical protein
MNPRLNTKRESQGTRVSTTPLSSLLRVLRTFKLRWSIIESTGWQLMSSSNSTTSDQKEVEREFS